MSTDATSAEWCLFIRALTELRYHILVFVEFVMSPEILDVDIVCVLAVDVSHLLLEMTRHTLISSQTSKLHLKLNENGGDITNFCQFHQFKSNISEYRRKVGFDQ